MSLKELDVEAGPPAVEPTKQVGARFDLLRQIERFALVGLVLILVIFFWVWSKTGTIFMSGANWQVLLANQSVDALLALGAVVPLIANEYDVSVGSVMGVSAWAAAKAMSSGWPVVTALLLAMAIGAGLGSVNGFLIAKMRLSSFVTTLAMWTGLAGLISLASNNAIIDNVPNSLINFGANNFLGVPKIAWVVLGMSIVLWFILSKTVAGRYLYAIGSNARSARLVGIRVERMVFLSFVTSATIAGLAGFVLVARSGSADPSVGPDFTLPALTACFLGATAIRPGRFNVWGTIVGIMLVGVSVSGLTLAGAAGWVSSVFNATALVVALLVSTQIAKRRGEIRS